MRRIWKGIFGLVAAGAVALLLFIYFDPVMTHVSRWTLEHQCKKAFGTPMSHSGIEFGEGTITVHHPYFTQTIDEDQGWDLTADTLLIQGRFLPWHRDRFVDVTLVNPKLNIYTSPEGQPVLDWFHGPKGRLPEGQWRIENGLATIHSTQDSESLELTISGAGGLGESARAALDLHIAGEGQNDLLLTFDQHDQGAVAGLELKQVSFASLAELMGCLDGRIGKGWDVKKGVIEGEGTIHLPKGSRPFALGEMQLEDFQFHHRASGADGIIPLTHIQFERDTSRVEGTPTSFFSQLIQGTRGRLEFLEPGRIRANPEQSSPWALEDIAGVVTLHSSEVMLDVESMLRYGSTACLFQGAGQLEVGDLLRGELGLSWIPTQARESVSSSRVLFTETVDGNQLLTLDLNNVGEEQAVVLHAIGSDLFPEYAKAQLSSGRLSGQIDLIFTDGLIRELRIEQLSAHALAFSLPHWQMEGKLESAEGRFRAAVTENRRLRRLSSDLQLAGGALEWVGPHGQRQLLDDVEVELAVARGELRQARLSAKLDGLEGTLETNRLTEGGGVAITLGGPIAELSSKLPKGMRKALLRSFAQDRFEARAWVSIDAPAFEVDGICQIVDPNGNADEIPFGLRMVAGASEVASSPSGLGLWLELAASLAESQLSDPRHGLKVEQGWFRGRDLQASKYALPLIRKPVPTSMSGILDFEAAFDDELLTVQYEGRDVELECRSFRIEAPKLGDLSTHTAESQRAYHYLNLLTGHEAGIIPVHDATYYEKKTGLVLENSSGYVSLRPDQVEVKEVTTSCEGLAIAGDVVVQDVDEAGTDVTIHATSMEGPVDGAQRLLSHIKPSRFWDLPLSGHLQTVEDGFWLKLHMNQDKPTEASITTRLENGTWQSSDRERSLEGLTALISYDHTGKRLSVESASAEFRHGDRSYEAASTGIAFVDFPAGEFNFDFALTDHGEEVARLVGRGGAADLDGTRECLIDNSHSHFAGLRPQVDHLVVRDWHHPVSVSAKTDFDLAQLPQTAQLLGDLGWDSEALQAIANVPGPNAAGTLSGSVSFEEEGGLWSVELNGEDVVIQDHSLHHFSLVGKASSNTWTIDELVADSLVGQFAIQPEGDRWYVPFLYISDGNAISVEASGCLDPVTRQFAGELRSLQLDLDRVGQWPKLGQLSERLRASGRLIAQGQFQLQLDERTPWGWKTTLDSQVTLDEVQLAGMAVQPTQEISCHLSPDGELVMAGLEAALLPDNASLSDRRAITASLDSASYQLGAKEWSIDALRFVAPHDQAAWLAEAVGGATLDTGSIELSSASLQALQGLKRDGEIGGALKLSSDGEGLIFQLELDDDVYQLGEQPVLLKGAKILSQSGRTVLSARTEFRGQEFWLTTVHDPEESLRKEILISDCPFEERHDDDLEPLTVALRRNHQDRFVVDRIHGHVSGAAVDLARQWGASSRQATSFVGTIEFDASQAASLLPDGLARFTETAQMGRGYWLSGRFILPEGDLSQLNFSGNLRGQEFVLRGYELHNLNAKLQFSPSGLMVSSLSIRDPAGHIAIDRISGRRNAANQWEFEIPSVRMANVQAGLLHSPGSRAHSKPPFVITHAELTGLKGDQSGLESWTGKGTMHFSKSLPGQAQFTIPEELRHRRNAESSRLTPAQGTVQFSIHDRALYLDKLHNTYSDGKRTKFYLARGQGPSFIDFDGNLHLKMRVKQRNLLLKIFTEPFTIHVKGSIDKPRWSLRSTKT